MLRIALLVLALVLPPAWAGPATAHGGDDHGAAPAVSATSAPRVESVGTDFELVAVAEGHTLTIYLDRVATNEPIEGATIEVSGGEGAAVTAKSVAPGTYALDADWLDTPGTKALVFTVTAGDSIDLLNGTLSIPAPAAEAPTSSFDLLVLFRHPEAWALLACGLLAGFLVALALIPRRGERGVSAAGPHNGDAGTTRDNQDRRSGGATGQAAALILVAGLGAVLVLGSAGTTGALAHGDDDHVAKPAVPAVNAPRKLPDGRVFLPKPTQRLLEVRTEPAEDQKVQRTRELMGTVVPDPSAEGQVQAPMDGKIELADRGISYVGQRVRAGEVLALLSPTIPVADLGTMQQLRAEVEGKLKLAELKLARLTRIQNVIAQRDIDDTKAELAALQEQQRVLAPKDIELMALKAPVDGIIAVANVRAGQVVSARDTLFEIVDPARLWVEATGADLHAEGDIVAANGRDAENHPLQLTYIGRAPALRQQARPFMFRVGDHHEGLAIGAPVKVLVASAEEVRGIVLPDVAVVRGTSGLLYVWIKETPETFRAAEVRTVPLDAERTVVVAGVKPGERVVVRGAELINQVR
ncbi:MAG: efflux RND transporter periplasmic adaptor subunit [Hyphomicrobium sp.]|nr:efflux RND transporter periplasmic adaptor subunit [Hyphomicrobium sp.]